MSVGVVQLHSHSGLERELRMPKYVVLVDVKYRNLFVDCPIVDVSYGGVTYCKVPIKAFVKNGGLFKNLNA